MNTSEPINHTKNMNQTQKRLSIVKLAISITDIETIQLQLMKLSLIKSDEKLQEIIDVLQAKNYAHAQNLITTYVETPNSKILQRTKQESEELSPIQEAPIPTPTPTQKPQISIDDFPKVTQSYKHIDPSDFDSLLNISASDVLVDNIDIDSELTSKDTFFSTPDKEAKTQISTEEEDSFFAVEEPTISDKETLFPDYEAKQTRSEDIFEETKSMGYKIIPYIKEKYISMKKRYPTLHDSHASFESVETLLEKIRQSRYTEEEIEEKLQKIDKLIKENNPNEAAHILIACGATESKYAQLMLARALYKGDLLKQNIEESFSILNTLVLDDDPEAMCDLAQFYEYGIGTKKDKNRAEELYMDAMELGIARAKKHYIRLQKENRSFFRR